MVAMAAMSLVACSTPSPTTSARVQTDYQPDGIYVLQRELFLCDKGFALFSSVDNPRYFLSPAAEDQDAPLIAKRSRLQYKKLRLEEPGARVSPVGVLLDPPHSGTPVMLERISQNADLADHSITHRFVNPKFLKITGKRKP